MKTCKINGCGSKFRSKGFCNLHYMRKRLGINMKKPKQIRDGLGYSHVDGYRVLSIKGFPMLEHRFIIESHIGRKLRKNEIVHHINHNRSDNRLDNLKMMTRTEHSKMHCPKGTKFGNNLYPRKKNCTICINPHLALGFCRTHYRVYRKSMGLPY